MTGLPPDAPKIDGPTINDPTINDLDANPSLKHNLEMFAASRPASPPPPAPPPAAKPGVGQGGSLPVRPTREPAYPAYRPAAPAAAAASTDRRDADPAEVERRALAYLSRMPASVQGSNGSADLMRAARAMVWGFGLDCGEATRLMMGEWNQRCVPPWSEREIEHACGNIRDGDEPRGHLRDEARTSGGSSAGPVERVVIGDIGLGGERLEPVDPNNPWSDKAEPIPPAADTGKPERGVGVEISCPRWLAEVFLHRFQAPDGLTLRHSDDGWLLWGHGTYRSVSDGDIDAWLNCAIATEFDIAHRAAMRFYELQAGKGDSSLKAPKREKIPASLSAAVMKQAKSLARLSVAVDPCWLDSPDVKAVSFASFNNGILDFLRFADGDRGPAVWQPPTPRFFTRMSRGYNFNPDAAPPEKWLRFLAQVWPDEQESIDCLQEYFGYLFSSDMSHEKMLYLRGMPASGKGTILDMIRRVVGEKNVTAPTGAQLGTNFGLAPFLGKSVAIMDDARWDTKDSQVVLERFLTIVGRGRATIDRKNRDHSEEPLPTRFVVASNNLPRLRDPSAALLRRLLILRTAGDFAGQENNNLREELADELPGVLLWALEGLRRLTERGRFVQPPSGQEDMEIVRSLSSNVMAFVDDCCEVDPTAFTSHKRLYEAWKRWCTEQGIQYVVSRPDLIADFTSALGYKIKDCRPGDGAGRERGFKGLRLTADFIP